ncbi:GNAT family N-acetyltransferase [Furfurilactobacillus curtus]|uniref:Alanine acetyltransferase n=1 Tax=Furfurilactobacillus curtus TaxID=1746200 RepID=A0ABQ5JRC4_9LACO
MQFERYHPIMTAHYVLDWLTMYKVKDIFALRHDETVAAMIGRNVDADLMTTTTYVNRTMSQVMNNEALIWGIGDKLTQQYLGTFSFLHFDTNRTVAEIQFELLPVIQQHGVMTEVLTHMMSFAFDELNLKRLLANVSEENRAASDLLIAQGFSAVDHVGRVLVYELIADQR